ncbi:MAG: replication factor C small subunit [archaeon]
MQDLWIEKYRPEKLDDVIGQDNIVSRLKAYVNQGYITHLLFSGSAGTGKTACAHALCKELYGENFEENFTEMNASDERGIDTVRYKIKEIAETMPVNASFKTIFLDEVDSLTPDAQSALRRTMEKYSENCRFILSCNYVSKLIDPIQSRCANFTFGQLSSDKIIKQLKKIATDNGMDTTDDGLESLVYASKGDMRKAINYLQSIYVFDNSITAENVFKVAPTVPIDDAKELVDSALKGNLNDSRSYLDKMLFVNGYSGEDIVDAVFQYLTSDFGIENEILAEIFMMLQQVDFALTEGSNDRIQLSGMIAKICSLVYSKEYSNE